MANFLPSNIIFFDGYDNDGVFFNGYEHEEAWMGVDGELACVWKKFKDIAFVEIPKVSELRGYLCRNSNGDIFEYIVVWENTLSGDKDFSIYSFKVTHNSDDEFVASYLGNHHFGTTHKYIYCIGHSGDNSIFVCYDSYYNEIYSERYGDFNVFVIPFSDHEPKNVTLKKRGIFSRSGSEEQINLNMDFNSFALPGPSPIIPFSESFQLYDQCFLCESHYYSIGSTTYYSNLIGFRYDSASNSVIVTAHFYIDELMTVPTRNSRALYFISVGNDRYSKTKVYSLKRINDLPDSKSQLALFRLSFNVSNQLFSTDLDYISCNTYIDSVEAVPIRELIGDPGTVYITGARSCTQDPRGNYIYYGHEVTKHSINSNSQTCSIVDYSDVDRIHFEDDIRNIRILKDGTKYHQVAYNGFFESQTISGFPVITLDAGSKQSYTYQEEYFPHQEGDAFLCIERDNTNQLSNRFESVVVTNEHEEDPTIKYDYILDVACVYSNDQEHKYLVPCKINGQYVEYLNSF